jgi:CRP-like cAMP-binding protein
LAIQTFGVDAFRAAIDRAMDLALDAQQMIASDDRLELITAASLGVLTFRRRGSAGQTPDEVDRANEAIVASLAADGDVLLTSTVIGGRYAIRLCVLNHTSGRADVEHALERVASAEPRLASEDARHARHAERAAVQAGVAIDWLTARDMTADDLRRIGLFEAVTDDQAGRLLATAREETYEMGDAVTERWALARTFYLVRSGGLSVRVGDREVNTLRRGDHFGEIAAIDWGRDFSYGRTATVVATETTHLLAFPAAALRELMLDNAAVDRSIRRIAQTRLATR